MEVHYFERCFKAKFEIWVAQSDDALVETFIGPIKSVFSQDEFYLSLSDGLLNGFILK
jgi:hypothetical protein